jgi:hypothetical protein
MSILPFLNPWSKVDDVVELMCASILTSNQLIVVPPGVPENVSTLVPG